jgi:hypothetical protein
MSKNIGTLPEIRLTWPTYHRDGFSTSVENRRYNVAVPGTTGYCTCFCNRLFRNLQRQHSDKHVVWAHVRFIGDGRFCFGRAPSPLPRRNNNTDRKRNNGTVLEYITIVHGGLVPDMKRWFILISTLLCLNRKVGTMNQEKWILGSLSRCSMIFF